MSETSFSLLSQEEIDTLISFLTDKANNFDSEILSQDSIDKLVSMMRANWRKPSGNRSALESVRAVSKVLTPDKEWTMDFEINEKDFVVVYATDGDTKEMISPRGYSCACFVDDDGTWGYSISPVQFVDIAIAYDLKFTKSVYERVQKRFCVKNFGDENYNLDDFFHSPTQDLLGCLI